MTETDVKRTLVQLDIDQAASKRVQAGTAAIKQRLEDVRAEIRVLGREFGVTDNRLAKYGKMAESVGRDIDKLQAELDGAEKAVKQLDRTMASASGADKYATNIKAVRQEAQTLGRFESGVRGVASAAGTLGGSSVQSQIAIGAELVDAAQGIQILRAELPALVSQLSLTTTGMIALGGALGAGYLALDAYNKTLKREEEQRQRNEEVAKRQTAAMDTFFQAMQDGTTATIRSAIAANEASIKYKQAQQEFYQGHIDAAQPFMDALAAQDRLWNRAGAAIVDATDEQRAAFEKLEAQFGEVTPQLFDEWNQKIVGLQGEIDDLNLLNGLYTDSLDTATVAINDAKAAEEDLAEARQKTYEATLQNIDEQAAYADQLRRAVAGATEDQVDAQIADFKFQQAELTDQQRLLYLEYEKGSITLAQLIVQWSLAGVEIEKLNFKISDWNTLVRDAAGMRAFLADREQKLDELMFRRSEKLNAGFTALAQKTDQLADSVVAASEEAEKYADTLAKRELKLAQDAEKFALERTRDLADHYAEMAELDADYYRERGDIIRDMRADLASVDQERIDELEDLNDDLEDLARDHADSMRKIERDANRDLQTATAHFDAWGIFQAQQSRRDALEDEQDQYAKEKEEREEQFADKLKMLEREREETQRAAEQALRDLEDQHRRERSAKERAFAEELRREDENRRLQLKHQKQQWDLEDQQRQAHFSNQSGKTITHYANLEGMADLHFATMEAKFAAGFGKMAASASLPSSAGAVAQDAVDFFLATMGTSTPSATAASRGPEAARFAPARSGTGSSRGVGSGGIGSIQFGDIIVPAVAGGVSPDDIKSAIYDAVIEAAEAIA